MQTVTTNGIKLQLLDTGGAGRRVCSFTGSRSISRCGSRRSMRRAARWRLIAPDLKGAGESEGPDDPAQYTMASYADELKGSSMSWPRKGRAGGAVDGRIRRVRVPA